MAGRTPGGGVSFEIHRILEKLDDRLEVIQNSPEPPGGGRPRWTQDGARRLVGWRVESPQTAQEKVESIHDLAADDQVAAGVATDFLGRPNVAVHAADDDAARHLFNRAQTDRWRQQDEQDEDEPVPSPQESPVTPVIRHLDRQIEFLDLIGACHKFVAVTGRDRPSRALAARTASARRRAGAGSQAATSRDNEPLSSASRPLP